MSEYKNGLNSIGNMSVGKDDISHDPVTGRAVFIDDDRYDADSAYKAKVDGLIKQGFHKVSEGSGGGGSSDFSTAQVTLICNSPEGDELRCAVARAIEADPPFVPTAQSWGNLSLTGGEEMVVTVILYKGRCYCTFENATSASGTGAIEDICSTGAIITGDCTLTLGSDGGSSGGGPK